MIIQRYPRVSFNLELLPARGARKELARRFEQHLSKHFGPVRTRRLLFPIYLLILKLSSGDFAVGIARRRRWGPDYRAWYIAIDPARGNVPNEEQRKHAKDLILISDEIHALLSGIPEITRLRWYFDGWDNKTPGVRTPAELPWHLDIPELRRAQHP